MQSTESRSLQLEMNGRWHERYCPTPPHPSPLNAEHRVQESSTLDERDVTWTLLPHPTPPMPWMQSIESRSLQLEMNGTWHERYCPTPPHPSPLNAEHRAQESSTWDERDVTWTLLPHPTPPMPPWMQSTESRSLQLEMNGTWHERYCPTPPHPSPPRALLLSGDGWWDPRVMRVPVLGTSDPESES